MSLDVHPDWEDYAGMFALLEAAGAGYVRVIPATAKHDAAGKAPAGKGWQASPQTLAQVEKHYLRGGNVGLLCGHDRLIVVDADAKNPATTAAGIVAAWPALAGTLVITRATAPERAKYVIRIVDGDPLPNAKKAGGLEVLAAGNQAVIAGTHAGNGNDVPPSPLLWRCDTGQILVATSAQVAALVATVTGKPAPEPSFVLPEPPANGFGVDDLEEGGGKATHPLRGARLVARRRAYIDDAVSAELSKMFNAPFGRNDALNTAAFALGTLAAGVGEPTGEIEAKLLSVALEIGLDENEATKTIRSGLEAGGKRPRDLPAWWNDAGDDDTSAAAGDDDATAEGGRQQGADTRQGYELRGAALWHWYEKNGKDDATYTIDTPVADFHLCIVGRVIAEDGAETWQLAGAGVRSGPLFVEIPAASFGDTAKLTAALEKASPLDGVYPGQHSHLRKAIKNLTEGEPVTTRRYIRTGWAGERFLFPGREPEGVTLALPPKLPYSFPPAAQLVEGLRGLAAVLRAPGDLGRGAALVSFVLQGPAAKPAGLQNERYALFVTGRTGSLKTSTVQAAMTIYGDGWADDSRLLKWGEGATRNAIMAVAGHAHDLPFVIDNYKPGTGDGAAGAVALLHNVIEGSDRDRVQRDGTLRTSKPIAAWPLCTGEDIPSGDAATIARILVLPFAWQRGTENEALTEAQGLAQHMPAVGAAWLAWLEGEGGALAAEAGKQFGPMRTRWAAYLRKVQPDMVNILRVASNLASNQLVYLLACEHPDIGPILRPFRDALDATLRDVGRAMGGLTVESLEAERWLSHLRSLVASGRAVILDVNDSEATVKAAQSGNKVVGYRDGAGVYVLPTEALAVMVAVSGRDVINGVSSNTLNKQLVEIGAIATQGKDRVSIGKKINGVNTRVIHLHADILSEAETEPELSESGNTFSLR